MRVDLHNHTHFCNHANGSQEEYVKKAIELGIDVFGFSEHAPISTLDGGYRLTSKNLPRYIQETKRLQKEYADKIDILLAFEVDFINNSPVVKEILDLEVDYLIGSVHFLDNWGFDNPEHINIYKEKNIDKIWEEYFEAIKNMAKTQAFDIVGHLDLIKVFKFLPKKDIRLIAKDAIKEIKKSNMTVEINSAGFKKPINEQYPSKQLLEICYEEGIDITFSSDAHSVEQVGLNYEKARQIAKTVGYTKCATFKNRQKMLVSF